jgi:hypothetical protein
MTDREHRLAGQGPAAPPAPARAPTRREQRVLLAFTLGYVAAFGVYATVARQARFLVYAPLLVLLVVAVAGVQARVGLGRGVLWGLSLWGLAHMAGGLLPAPGRPGAILYDVGLVPGLLRYDRAVHAWGFGVATVACWQAVRGRLGTGRVSVGVALMVWLMGMGLGAVNEVVEFLASLALPGSHVGGYENTGWDLVFNLLGGGAAAAWLHWRRAGA